MSRAAFAFIVMSFVILLPSVSQDRGLLTVTREITGKADFDVGRQVAVIIGIDRYREWPSLGNAVSEAKKVKAVLAKRYYIDEFVELYDESANAEGIRRLFAQELPKKLGIRDSLLVFYAGHGYLDASKTGFWIASDGAKNEFSQFGWIPNAQIRNYISNLKAQRVLVLADSCFSGDFLNVHRGNAPVVDSDYYRKALQLTARQVLTSGASESVPDDSEFGAQLLSLLERNTEKLLDPYSMYDRIKLGMTKTLPLMGSLPGNEQGASFVLFLKPEDSGASNLATVVPQAEKPTFVVTRAYGNITVTAATKGTLYLDGRAMGELPAIATANLGKIEAGERKLELRYGLGKSEIKTITVVEGLETAVVFTWEKAAPPAKVQAKTRIGLSFPDLSVQRWKSERDTMSKLLKVAGFDVLFRDAKRDAGLQNDQIREMATLGAAVLIVVAEDGVSVASAVDEVATRGVKVIAYERLIKSTAIAAYLSFDDQETGRAQARAILSMKDSGSFVLLGGSPADNRARLLHAGQMEILQPIIDSGRIKVVSDRWVENWDPAKAKALMTDILVVAQDRIDAVLTSDDGMALGAIEAMKASALADLIPVSGRGATEAGCNSIARGELTFTLIEDTRRLSPIACELAAALAGKEAIPSLVSRELSVLSGDAAITGEVPCAFVEAVMVDVDNLRQLVVDSGLHSSKIVYKDLKKATAPKSEAASVADATLASSLDARVQRNPRFQVELDSYVSSYNPATLGFMDIGNIYLSYPLSNTAKLTPSTYSDYSLMKFSSSLRGGISIPIGDKFGISGDIIYLDETTLLYKSSAGEILINPPGYNSVIFCAERIGACLGTGYNLTDTLAIGISGRVDIRKPKNNDWGWNGLQIVDAFPETTGVFIGASFGLAYRSANRNLNADTEIIWSALPAPYVKFPTPSNLGYGPVPLILATNCTAAMFNQSLLATIGLIVDCSPWRTDTPIVFRGIPGLEWWPTRSTALRAAYDFMAVSSNLTIDDTGQGFMAGLSLIWGSFDISINYSLRSIPTRLIPGLVQNGAQIIQLGLVWNGLGTRKK